MYLCVARSPDAPVYRLFNSTACRNGPFRPCGRGTRQRRNSVAQSRLKAAPLVLGSKIKPPNTTTSQSLYFPLSSNTALNVITRPDPAISRWPNSKAPMQAFPPLHGGTLAARRGNALYDPRSSQRKAPQRTGRRCFPSVLGSILILASFSLSAPLALRQLPLASRPLVCPVPCR